MSQWYVLHHLNTIQAIMAEGKEHALAIGLTKMSTEEMYVLAGFHLLLSYILVQRILQIFYSVTF